MPKLRNGFHIKKKWLKNLALKSSEVTKNLKEM